MAQKRWFRGFISITLYRILHIISNICLLTSMRPRALISKLEAQVSSNSEGTVTRPKQGLSMSTLGVRRQFWSSNAWLNFVYLVF